MTIVEPDTVGRTTHPRPAASPKSIPVEISQADLVDLVRQMRATAHQLGQRPPGRPALAKKIGVSTHRVRRALEEIARTDQHIVVVSHQPAGDADVPPDRTTTAQPSPETGPARPIVLTATPEQPVPGPAVAQCHTDRDNTYRADRAEELAPPGANHGQAHTVGGRPWPLMVIGLAAAVSVWSGWVGLGQLAGFGVIQPLPGVWDSLRLNSAIVLPISVEAYAAYALRCWLTSRAVNARARRFAMWSAITSLVIGAAAQIAFHLMTAAGMTRAPWPVIVGVATVPVAVLGLATALASLTRTDQATNPRWHERRDP